MPFDGSGNYNPPAGSAAVTGTVIDSTKFNALLDDLVAALSGSLRRSGESALGANLSIGGYRLTNVGGATADTDAMNRAGVYSVRDALLALIDVAQDTADAALPASAVTTFGLSLINDIDAAAAQQTLGGGTTGRAVFGAANSDTAFSAMGATALGTDIAQAADGPAVRLLIGAAPDASDIQTFDSSGTWSKPAFGTVARIQAWGGGGGGARETGTDHCSGGGGGGYNERWVLLSSLGATETVTVGAGGAGRSGSTGIGTDGGTSTFGSLVSAYGGAGGSAGGNAGAGCAAGGGTPLASGQRAFSDSADALPPAVLGNAWMWAGAPSVQPWGSVGALSGVNGQSTLFGGGSGGCAGQSASTVGGSSQYGGNGGAGGRSTVGIDGVQPGGGGGGRNNNLNGGNGAAGRVVVMVF